MKPTGIRRLIPWIGAAVGLFLACTLLLASYVVGSAGAQSTGGIFIAVLWAASILFAVAVAAVTAPVALTAARTHLADRADRGDR